MIAKPIKYLTTTSPAYRDLTAQMIASSGQDDWEIIEESNEGDFGTENFNRLCNSRMSRVAEILKAGQDVFVCDGDVLWLEPIADLPLGYFDIVAQHDPDSGLCAGVCYYRATRVTAALVDVCATIGKSPTAPNDQVILNNVVGQVSRQGGSIKLGYLHNVLSWGLSRGDNSLWDGQPLDVPEYCHAWHANYTVGIDNKAQMLRQVRDWL